ncbi:hypothetical protein EBU99_09915 [bacterium]|nr:hypothetical protein [bacterium]
MSTSVGRRAECCVEEWFESEGWTCFERNLRVPGGEVDRMFVRQRGVSALRVDLCVAEVKATHLKNSRGADRLFAAERMRSFVRPRQLRILWRSAAAYEAQLQRLTRAPVRTYVRYFLVVYGTPKLLGDLKSSVESGALSIPVRFCRSTQESLILAWTPDACTVAF